MARRLSRGLLDGGERLTAKDFLKTLRTLNMQVRALQTTHNQLKSDVRTLKAVDYSKDRVDGGHSADMGDLVARCIDTEQELKDEIRTLLKMKRTAFTLIKQIDDPVSKTVLLLRYVNNRPWVLIQKQMSYAESQMYVLHRKAIKDFTDVYEHRSKS